MIQRAVFIAFFLAFLPVSFAAERTYTFAVVPQQSATELADTWEPFLAWLSKKSGIALKFVTAPDIVTFENRLSSGNYDLAYMNPYHYTVYHQAPGYQALAKEKNRRLKGILVTRTDSPIKNINELNGLAIAFPAPAAFAASILPRAELRREGILFTPKFVASHESVYLNVANGFYVAGGGITRTFDLLDESTRKKLRILWSTPTYTPHAIASHPQLPPAVANQLLAAMRDMSNDATGQILLKKLGFQEIEAANDADYADVRQLKITERDAHAE